MRLHIIISLFCMCFLYLKVVGQEQFPYKDPSLSIEERVKDLLNRMTLEEKIDQLNMKGLSDIKINSEGEVDLSSLDSVFKGKSIGCLETPFIECEQIATLSEAADKYLRTQTRLGIPAIQAAVCQHGHMALGATIFPQSIGLGATWNPLLAQKMSEVMAQEASLTGDDQALAPLLDLARDPRYGRVEECFGEDPFLVKEMGVAFIIGFQGDSKITKDSIPTGKLACTGKHFVAYSVPEAGINLAPALVGERTLRELHFYSFQKAVTEANVYSIMPGYHEVDGIPVHANRWLLTDILREEWNFPGYVISDYSAIGMLNGFHFISKDKSESAIKALHAGVDVEAPRSYAYSDLKKLVEEGKISDSEIDTAVTRVLRVKFKLGLFDKVYEKPQDLKQQLHKQEYIDLAQQMAEESMVLLKNKNNILPLDMKKLNSIAVIGPNADRVQFGDYSITKNNDYGVTVLEGIKKYVGDNVTINYAEGCGITNLSKERFSDAVKTAEESDLVVLVLGGTSVIYSGIGWGDANSKEVNTCGEGFDRNELNFPGVQPDLLRAISATGKPIVLVMINGRPYTIPEEVEMVDAVLEAWYPGEQGGTAVSRILFGEVNPSGRLPITFPKTTGHIPVYANHKPSGKGYYKQPGLPEKPGRDYVFSSPEPLFCFGYGLSYTTFEYKDLRINKNLNEEKGNIEVRCQVKNTGLKSGMEVVQLYVRDKISSVTTPVKALKAFKKYILSQEKKKKFV